MAVLKSFKAVRPRKDLANLIAALPYDVMDSDEARKIVENNEYSFLHVDKAEVDLDRDIDVYDDRVYEKASQNLKNMIDNNLFIKDKKESLYVYRQTMNGREQTGVVGCCSIDDYLNNVIKKHEYTKPDKEQDRIKHVDKCNANTGPIFLSYHERNSIDKIIGEVVLTTPEYDFISDDNIRHTVWVINDNEKIEELISEFNKVKSIYIADGHHRTASAVEVGLKRREQNPGYSGDEEFNYFLAVLFPAEKLKIMDYNRVIKDLNGYSSDEFIKKVKEKFIVEDVLNDDPYRPEKKHEFGMYLDNKWYKLTAIDGTFDSTDDIKNLDVQILDSNLITPILGITDPKSDKRVDFVGGIRGLGELERRANTDMRVAFSMYPTTMQEIMNIADSGRVMPAKSTWFEPKLRSGLFIHELG